MLGIVLLLLALCFYFSTRYRYLSYFLYLSFMMGYGGGFGLWTNAVLGMKNTDLALIYTLTINGLLFFTGKWEMPDFSFKKAYIAFLLFLGCSVMFSFVYYGLTPYQILQGGRRFLLILSLPILIRATPKEVDLVLKFLFNVCIITSILYILQILVFRKPLMSYALLWDFDESTGFPRLYNIPANLHFFLALSFLSPRFFPQKINITVVRLVLFVALLCTLGRTYIVVGVATVMLVMAINGSFKKFTNAFIIVCMMFFPFYDAISQRYDEGGKTSNDIQAIMRKDFGDDYVSQGDATMLYRFAWCYERADYLLERPFGEQIFGMGLCSDSQDWVNKKYNFKLGLRNELTGLPEQLGTPDTSYGNMITYLGFGGTIIYIFMCVSIAIYFWENRKKNHFFLLCAGICIMMFLISFAGSMMSETNSFCLSFLIMSLAYHKGKGLYKFEYSRDT